MISKSTPNHTVPVWQYDEMKNSGVDYQDAATVAEYDSRHAAFRDYEAAARLIIERLGLDERHTVIDMGCGTGAFALTAARYCKKIHAVDISMVMLERLMCKAALAGISNIETHHAGFLTYAHGSAPVDAVVCVAALHHLPDFWKAVALERMWTSLKPEGRLYIFDVVFPFSAGDHKREFDKWVGGMRLKAGDWMEEEAVIHIRDEFSTFDWIMEGLLERAGFQIERTFHDFPLCMTFICGKHSPL